MQKIEVDFLTNILETIHDEAGRAQSWVDRDRPELALDAAVAVRKEAERVEASLVLRSREAGLTWEHIAKVLGTTRSNVWQRFHTLGE